MIILHAPALFMLLTLFLWLLASGAFYMYLVGLCSLLCSLCCWLWKHSTCTWLVYAGYFVLYAAGHGSILHVPGWFMLFTLFSRLLAMEAFYMNLVGLCCLLCSLGCWLGGEFYMHLDCICCLICSFGC